MGSDGGGGRRREKEGWGKRKGAMGEERVTQRATGKGVIRGSADKTPLSRRRRGLCSPLLVAWPTKYLSLAKASKTRVSGSGWGRKLRNWQRGAP